ncbi:hypothetical protein DERF_002878 [Dermatophagoides farinae]|uniref:Uncharacterized protein n=1 Tax=Dermatophagoides farinae TaxID=6954 RepID=A0A922LB13_DERFA|nr:hypothetical protein DERF_002878 [Dermatophagoides farinae]
MINPHNKYNSLKVQCPVSYSFALNSLSLLDMAQSHFNRKMTKRIKKDDLDYTDIKAIIN